MLRLWEVTIMNRLTRTTAAVCGTVFACGMAAGIALAFGVADGHDHGAPATHTTEKTPKVAQTVESELAAAYRFLASGSSTALPRSLAPDIEHFGVNPSLGRKAGSVRTEHLWLVPGASRSCLELDDGGSACGPNAFIARHGVWITLVPVTGATPTMYGIVPDGATVSGVAGSAKVSQSGHAVVVVPSSRTTGKITIHTASGTTVDLPVLAATGHPQ